MIRYFVSHPTAANLLMIICFVIGIVSLPQLRRETFPDFAPHQLQIQVVYPGATPEQVDESICQRLEDAIDGINYLEEIRTEALEGLARVTIEMNDKGNFSIFVDDVKSEIDAINDFPIDAEDPVITVLNRVDKVLSLAIAGPMSTPDLKAYCEKIKEKLQNSTEISQINIRGFSDHQILIEINNSDVLQYGLSIQSITNSIAKQNINLPTGNLQTENGDLLLRFNEQKYIPRDFEKLVVAAGQAGGEIYLGDIATIRETFELDEEKTIFGTFISKDNILTFDGKRAGLLEINKTKGQDSLTIVDMVTNFVEQENKIAPTGVTFTITQDSSSIVKDRLQMLITNGWQGMLLVFLTMWLFFSMRFSFWVVMGLPVSFLGAFFFFPFIGFSINMITMVGLLLALGLLMDDAIVISENIASHLQQGKSALDATIDGVMQVGGGVISSFLTTVCIFGPLCFLEGNIGKVMRVMPVVLILVLSVSLIEAFLILPHHLAHSLQNVDTKNKNKIRKNLDAFLDWVRTTILGKTVAMVIRHNYLFIGCVAMIFIISIAMMAGGVLKFQAFPDMDGDVVEVRVLLTQGTPLYKTEKIVEKLVQALAKVEKQFPQIQNQKLIKNINIQYNKNIDAKEQGTHVVTISVDLLKADKRKASIDEILNTWRNEAGKIPDIVNLKFTEPTIGPAGLPIDILLQGDNLVHLKEVSLEIQQWLKKFKGVQDLFDDLRPGKPEIQIKLKEGSSSLGLQSQDIAQQIRAAFQGNTIDEIIINKESYEINVRLAKDDRSHLANIDYFYIIQPDGTTIPLQVLANISYRRGYSKLNSINGQRSITIQGDVNTKVANTSEIMAKMKKELIPLLAKKYSDVVVVTEGEEKETQKTASSLVLGFIIGLVGIFVILSFQFKSYVEPIIVMLTIPLALIGAIWGHIIMGQNLSMPSMIGFVSLAGVVVNDSILLIEFIKLKYQEGNNIVNAAIQASQERFRAVLLTSMTTIAGLIPLLLEKSLQAQVLIPLAISLVFGLLASTVLILVVIPCFYSILYDLNLAKPKV